MATLTSDADFELVSVLVQTLRLENKKMRKHQLKTEADRAKLKRAVKKLSKDNHYLREAFTTTRDRYERLLALTKVLVGGESVQEHGATAVEDLPWAVEAALLKAHKQAHGACVLRLACIPPTPRHCSKATHCWPIRPV